MWREGVAGTDDGKGELIASQFIAPRCLNDEDAVWRHLSEVKRQAMMTAPDVACFS
jgi:hypothetical protein